MQADPPGRATGKIIVTVSRDSELRWRSGRVARPEEIRPGQTVTARAGELTAVTLLRVVDQVVQLLRQSIPDTLR